MPKMRGRYEGKPMIPYLADHDATYRTLDEAALSGIPRQVAAPVSCEARGRINAERLSREIDEMMEVAEEDGD
jgi:hypothetical protein